MPHVSKNVHNLNAYQYTIKVPLSFMIQIKGRCRFILIFASFRIDGLDTTDHADQWNCNHHEPLHLIFG